MLDTYQGIIIGSGKSLVEFTLKQLKTFHNNQQLDLKELSGCGLGSIIIVLLAMKYNPTEIKAMMSNIDFSSIDLFSLKNIKTNYGMLKHEVISDIVKDCLLEKYGKVPTMKEFHEMTGKNIFICVTNLTREKTEYINHLSHPYLPIVKAIEMSISIIGLFEKCEWRDNLYIEGGATDPIPIAPLKDTNLKTLVFYNNLICKHESNILSYLNMYITVNRKRLVDLSLEKCNSNMILIPNKSENIF